MTEEIKGKNNLLWMPNSVPIQPTTRGNIHHVHTSNFSDNHKQEHRNENKCWNNHETCEGREDKCDKFYSCATQLPTHYNYLLSMYWQAYLYLKTHKGRSWGSMRSKVGYLMFGQSITQTTRQYTSQISAHSHMSNGSVLTPPSTNTSGREVVKVGQ